MASNRLFVSTPLLDGWMISGRADLRDGELRLPSGERFAVEEAVHVMAEVSGVGDAHRLVGRVLPVRELSVLDAEVLDRSMVIGDLAYDVIPGMLASPVGAGPVSTQATLARLGELSREAASPQSDEELLARYLMERLE